MDKLTKDQRRKNMQAVKSKGSKIELAFGKEMWNRGFRYRKNDKSVFGKPDFTLKKFKIAVFIDSEFWHGKNWEIRKYDHKTNQEFWINKIERNIQRDMEVNEYLLKNGWKVIRFWGKDIEKNIHICIKEFEQIVNEIKRKNIN